jgi:formylglycine-generating enzyme required for sulfatase activity
MERPSQPAGEAFHREWGSSGAASGGNAASRIRLEGGEIRWAPSNPETMTACPRRVRVRRSYLQQDEVTNAEYRDSTPSETEVSGRSSRRERDLVRRDGLRGVAEVPLPTEAQWEFAARLGGSRPRNGPRARARTMTMVGAASVMRWVRCRWARFRKERRRKIHDLAGNVWEWCRDA